MDVAVLVDIIKETDKKEFLLVVDSESKEEVYKQWKDLK